MSGSVFCIDPYGQRNTVNVQKIGSAINIVRETLFLVLFVFFSVSMVDKWQLTFGFFQEAGKEW